MKSDVQWGETLVQVPITDLGAADLTLFADPGDTKFRVILTCIVLSCGAAASIVKFKIPSGADIAKIASLPINGGTNIIGSRDSPVFVGPAGEGLALNSSAAGPINGWVIGFVEFQS